MKAASDVRSVCAVRAAARCAAPALPRARAARARATWLRAVAAQYGDWSSVRSAGAAYAPAAPRPT